MVEAVCPFCGVSREFVPKRGTNGRIMDSRIRCRKGDEGCGEPFHTSKNMVVVVPQKGNETIYQDKISNREEIIEKIKKTLDELEKYLPLDILRGKLLELQAIGLMRKK